MVDPAFLIENSLEDFTNIRFLNTFLIQTPGPMVNLTRLNGTTCTASSSKSSYVGCEKAMNEMITPEYNNEWTSDQEKEGAWLKVRCILVTKTLAWNLLQWFINVQFPFQITFPRKVMVFKVQIWRRCSRHDQCDELFLEFSDGSNFTVRRNYIIPLERSIQTQ